MNKKTWKKIAMILILVLVVNMFTGCAIQAGLYLAIGAGIVGAIMVVVIIIKMTSSEVKEASKNRSNDGIDTFSTTIDSMPENERSILEKKINSMPAKERSALFSAVNSFSGTELSAIAEVYNTYTEQMVVSAVEEIDAMPPASLTDAVQRIDAGYTQDNKAYAGWKQ